MHLLVDPTTPYTAVDGFYRYAASQPEAAADAIAAGADLALGGGKCTVTVVL